MASEDIQDQMAKAWGSLTAEEIGRRYSDWSWEQVSGGTFRCPHCNRHVAEAEAVWVGDGPTRACGSYCADRLGKALGYPEEGSPDSDG